MFDDVGHCFTVEKEKIFNKENVKAQKISVREGEMSTVP